MDYFDIAAFAVDAGLARRLGYRRIYCSGVDVVVSDRQQGDSAKQIIVSSDPGALIGALRSNRVVGIVFKDNELIKKVVEKASELGKTVYVPVGTLSRGGPRERTARLNRIRKIIISSHKLKARVRIVTMAASGTELVSAGQMVEIGRFLMKDGLEGDFFGGVIL